MAHIVIKNLQKAYSSGNGKKLLAIDIDDLTIPLGGIIAIVGGSGSGKTTFLNLVGGLESIEKHPNYDTQVELKLNSQRRPSSLVSAVFKKSNTEGFPYNRVSYIFQEGYLIKQASLAVNLAITRRAAGLQADKESLEQLLDQAQLNDKNIETHLGKNLTDRTVTLSGGQQQRINIARALGRDPELVFADELSSSLDPQKAEDVMGELKNWVWDGEEPRSRERSELNRSILWVTHDYHLAAEFADALIVLNGGKAASGMKMPLEVNHLENTIDAADIKSWVESSKIPVEAISSGYPESVVADSINKVVPRPQRTISYARAAFQNIGAGVTLSLMEAFPERNYNHTSKIANISRLSRPLVGFSHWVRALQLASILALIMIIIYGREEVIHYFDEQLNDPTLRHVIVQQNSRELRQSVINDKSLKHLSDSIRDIKDITGKASIGVDESVAFGRFTEVVDVYPTGKTKIEKGFVPEVIFGIFERKEPVYATLNVHTMGEEGCDFGVASKKPQDIMPYADRLEVIVTRKYIEDFKRMYNINLCHKPYLDLYDFGSKPVKFKVVGFIDKAPADGYDRFDALIDVDIWKNWYSGMGKPIYSSFSRAAVYFNPVNHKGVIEELGKRSFSFDEEIVSKFNRLIGTASQLRNTFVVIAWLTLAVAATVAGGLIWGYLAQNAKSIAVLRAHNAWFWTLFSAIPFQVLLTFSFAVFYLAGFTFIWNYLVIGTSMPERLALLSDGAWSPDVISWHMITSTYAWVLGSLAVMVLVGWFCLVLWRLTHRNLAHELRQAY